MTGRGETPTAEGEEQAAEHAESVGLGATVYDDDGVAIGTVRGVEEGGFFVTTREGSEGLSVEHARSGHDFGEAELMWRCTDCGEMGEIDAGFPEECPNCGTKKENIMWWTED